MTVNLRLSRSKVKSLSLEKLLKSQKNLSYPPPTVWLYDRESGPTRLGYDGLPALDFSHPVLEKLECCECLRDFRQIHSQLIVGGLIQQSFAASRVIKRLCTSLRLVTHAVSIFDSIHEPDAFLCNTILRNFLVLNDPSGALRFYYEKMIAKCVVQNHYTFPLLGKVCAGIGSVAEGRRIHTVVSKRGFESDLFVTNSLIHMYASCGRICDARKVFDNGSVLDLVSWNSMIDGYVKNNDVNFACQLFERMPTKDIFSWNTLLKGFAELENMQTAVELFECMPVRDIVSWNCLLDAFAAKGDLLLASELFDVMPARNIVSWNVMLALCVRKKLYSDCLRLFNQMIESGGVEPNEASLMSILTASTNLGRLDTGKWVHTYMREHGIEADILLSTALLTMYSKCGDMDSARDVFDWMPEKGIASWNSIVIGYGIQGHGEKAIEMFMEMEKTKLVPNDTTFVCVLSACAHSRMVLEGFWFFQRMYRVYNIKPRAEHYGCMVHLLSRSGLMKDSEEHLQQATINTRSGSPPGAFLSDCWSHWNPELGKFVARHLIKLLPDDIGPYVLLSYIHMVEGKWKDVENVRKIMRERKFREKANDSSYRKKMVFSMLREMATELKTCQGDGNIGCDLDLMR